MKYPLTGVILAGGLNTRFSGKNKAFFRVRGIKLLDRVYGIFKDLFEEIILVTNDPIQYLEWDLKIVSDLFPFRSSLTGIHTGLFYITTPFAFFAGCDTPFLKREIVETIINGIEPRIDVVIPETSAGLEPLCAVYSKECLKPIERHIKQQKVKIQRAIKNVRIKKIPESVLRDKDPALISFFNINTQDDLVLAESMVQ
jgi:molybdopterin-guanine dinucleotide biosynthesis protein A